ncbi:hypothetical protein ABB55_27720 [Prosthecomicrobium hirschii]|uniref:Zinc finger CHC2-type domain-containing protein n=1 Tax=Prosthecodimorpha hirschii TaxID=665126 RepID=A0A0P6VS43_9HYPH|nr:CHC2 zinc finger domain-containing protein [Prosthecomicrobium hirschii]KPL55555.1 hypothetical protein ABB55_27720 [Prosthecomicrobium hirschii]
MRYSDAALERLRADNPVDDVVGRLGGSLRRSGRDLVGACPICGGGKRATRFAVKPDGQWVCAVCPDGGDVIGLVSKVLGLDFPAACGWLGGQPDAATDARAAAVLAARAAERQAAAAERAAEAEAFRERERRRLWKVYCGAAPGVGSPVEALFAARGHAVDTVRLARLRYLAEAPYFLGEEGDPESPKPGAVKPRVIHVGPAAIAPILRPDGRFGGLHYTWFDLDRAPKCKAAIHDPETGEMLVDKKVRGSKQGGYIELVRVPAPRAMVAGEGLMTVSAVRTAYLRAGRPLAGVAFRVGVDLGNLAGKAAATIAHPSEKTPTGRARRVPGPEPDFDSPAMPVPDSVTDLRLLGDGDSDPFLTRAAMARCEARHRRPGRRVVTVWPPDVRDGGRDGGRDFDDMVRGG